MLLLALLLSHVDWMVQLLRFLLDVGPIVTVEGKVVAAVGVVEVVEASV